MIILAAVAAVLVLAALVLVAQRRQSTGGRRLWVYAAEAMGPLDDGSEGSRLELHAQNQSSRPITLWRWGFQTPNGLVFVPPRRHLPRPLHLNPGDSCCEWIPRDELAAFLLLFTNGHGARVELVGFFRGPLWQTHRAKPIVFSARP